MECIARLVEETVRQRAVGKNRLYASPFISPLLLLADRESRI